MGKHYIDFKLLQNGQNECVENLCVQATGSDIKNYQ